MGSIGFDDNHVHHFWGLSNPLDLKYLASGARTLAAALGDATLQDPGADPSAALRVLQIAPADPRHTLVTMAKAWRRDAERDVHTLVWEASVEGLGRHMLLTAIFLDTALTARDRMEIYLEVYGNIKLREKSAEYIEDLGKQLADVVLNSNFGEHDGPMDRLFDFSNLKYAEKDALVDVLRSYSRKNDYHMDQAWEWRCRKFYGNRYDHLRNLVDWDYHMRLLKTNPAASIIHFKHWREWRATGQAFEIRDATFTEPNRTLLSTATGRTIEFRDRLGKERGRSVTTRGLYSDMLTSPYIAHGVDSHEKFLFRKSNKQHIKTAVDIAEFNLLSLSNELYERKELKYMMTEEEANRWADTDEAKDSATTDDPGPSKDNIAPKLEVVSEAAEGGEDEDAEDAAAQKAAARALATAARFRIALVTGDLDKNVLKRNANKGKFDVITLGNSMTHRVKDTLQAMTKADAVLAMEDARYMMSLQHEQALEFATNMDKLAKESGWVPLTDLIGVAPEHHLFMRSAEGAVEETPAAA